MKIQIVLGLFAITTSFAACSSGNDTQGDAQADSPNDVTGSDVNVANDGGPSTDATSPLGFACSPPSSPNACPPPSGTAGEADFCFRAEWAGITGVDVYVGTTGQTSDWKNPATTLANDGSGRFTGKITSLADGSYPYLFRVHGSVDGLVRDGTYLLDQENNAFSPPVNGAPIARSLSLVAVPQSTTPPPLRHFRGTVDYAGAPQSCFSVALEVGELTKDGGGVLGEHSTANFTESASDGTFDFQVADGPVMAIVRYPFGLIADGGYPNPFATPSVGYARTSTEVSGADLTLDPVDVSYSESDYAAMSPTSGDASLPVTFAYSVVNNSSAAWVAVISTNIAGNDPALATTPSMQTSYLWNGFFDNDAGAALGTTYYWGTWQRRSPADAAAPWNEESLLFPITLH